MDSEVSEAGEMAQQSQGLAALPEDPSSVPRKHTELPVAPVPEDPTPSSVLPINVDFFFNLKNV